MGKGRLTDQTTAGAERGLGNEVEAAVDMSHRRGDEIHMIQGRIILNREGMKESHVEAIHRIEGMMEGIQGTIAMLDLLHMKGGAMLDMKLETEDAVAMILEIEGVDAFPEAKVAGGVEATGVILGIQGVEEAIEKIGIVVIVGLTPIIIIEVEVFF